MSNWAVFITAVRATPKVLNRAFLLIQDFEFGDYPATEGWTLLASKRLPTKPRPATSLPLPESIARNEFASMSLNEINTFVRTNEAKLEKADISHGNWLVIDQKGLETSTCVVCDQVYEDDEGEGEESGVTDQMRACRIPYEKAWAMVSNLDIANMSFEDFVDEDRGEQADGTWNWQSFGDEAETGDSGTPTEEEVKREEALQALRDTGDVE
ncbi:hypothetical protein DFH06DRAFT_1242534 [Mycena polygramma]|nr:hypothetical protein DFH06DRAFT_1242534 [Mycena polygramma]